MPGGDQVVRPTDPAGRHQRPAGEIAGANGDRIGDNDARRAARAAVGDGQHVGQRAADDRSTGHLLGDCEHRRVDRGRRHVGVVPYPPSDGDRRRVGELKPVGQPLLHRGSDVQEQRLAGGYDSIPPHRSAGGIVIRVDRGDVGGVAVIINLRRQDIVDDDGGRSNWVGVDDGDGVDQGLAQVGISVHRELAVEQRLHLVEADVPSPTEAKRAGLVVVVVVGEARAGRATVNAGRALLQMIIVFRIPLGDKDRVKGETVGAAGGVVVVSGRVVPDIVVIQRAAAVVDAAADAIGRVTHHDCVGDDAVPHTDAAAAPCGATHVSRVADHRVVEQVGGRINVEPTAARSRESHITDDVMVQEVVGGRDDTPETNTTAATAAAVPLSQVAHQQIAVELTRRNSRWDTYAATACSPPLGPVPGQRAAPNHRRDVS